MIAIIEYNAGNVKSVSNALNRLGAENIVTNNFETIKAADKVIFPGVGEAASAMQFLRKNKLDTLIKNLNQPVLGICLGLQLMCKHSEENDTECLGIFDEKVKLFPPEDKIPHIGWNNLSNKRENKLLDKINLAQDFYFVHSYYAEIGNFSIAETNYVKNFSSVIQKGNFSACQFHPEKSAKVGEQFLKNFLSL